MGGNGHRNIYATIYVGAKNIHTIKNVVGSTDQLAIYIKDSNVLNVENINWMQTKTKDIQDKYESIDVGVKSINTLVTNLSAVTNLSNDEYERCEHKNYVFKIYISAQKTKRMSSYYFN